MSCIVLKMVRKIHIHHWVPIGLFVTIMRGESEHGVGILRLEVSKALYERSGLNGKPIPDGGRKHLKTRYG